MVRVLIQCGDNLTRENVMRQTEDLHGLVVAMLLPGITIDTSLRSDQTDADDAIHGRAVGVVRTRLWTAGLVAVENALTGGPRCS